MKIVLSSKGLNSLRQVFERVSINPISTQQHLLTPPGNKPFENTVGKGEIARNEQFLLFPQCFSTHLDNFLPFSSYSKLWSANFFSLEESKICHVVMG